MYDIGICNGSVYTGCSFVNTNVYIKDGKIAALSTASEDCKKLVDAHNKLVLPGFIDPHVHFHLTVGKNTSFNDFHTGSIAGVLGGVTTYIDFLDVIYNTAQMKAAFEDRCALAKTSITDYAFHTTIANPTDCADKMIKAGLDYGINSVKLFTTYSDTNRRTFERYIYDLLRYSRTYNTRIVCHSEHDDLIWKNKKIPLADHENSRPSICERTAVMTLAEIAREANGLLYIVHVSAGRTVDALKTVYSEELHNKQIILESCPHYFMFTSDVYKSADGWKYTMTPPLRPEIDRARLNANIDYISTIGTDHCPFTPDLKKHEYTCDIPMGIGGITYSFLNMYALFGKDIVAKFTTGPAKAYNLWPRKGNLLPGADADIVIFDEHKNTIAQDPDGIYDKKKYNGAFDSVYAHGIELVHNGSLTQAANEVTGEYVPRC
ncbi:MAG: amidohydrolase family protein [Treponema sp.]|nr:amidohydrolase family protein [Treponema sp.]